MQSREGRTEEAAALNTDSVGVGPQGRTRFVVWTEVGLLVVGHSGCW